MAFFINISKICIPTRLAPLQLCLGQGRSDREGGGGGGGVNHPPTVKRR
jgi:hypothetical protein